MNTLFKKYFLSFVVLFIILSAFSSPVVKSVFAASADSGYHIITSIPGTNIRQGDAVSNNYSLAGYIKNLYIFSLGIVGLVAVFAMVYWSFIYTASAGNPSKMSDAIGGIKDAALGLILLLLASVVLGIINPKLTTLSPLDNLESVPQQNLNFGEPVWRQKCPNAGGGPGGFCVADCAGYGMIPAQGCNPSSAPADIPPGNNICCNNPTGPTG